MKYFSAFLDMGRYKSWAYKIFSCIQYLNYLKYCPASFSQSSECLISDLLHPELLSGGVEGMQLAVYNSVLVEVEGRCQFIGGNKN